ncbi:MAG: hypothetical protein ACXV2I_11375 [Actinomycetes bacterium]
MSDYLHRGPGCRCRHTAESVWISSFTRLVLGGWSPDELEQLSTPPRS